MTLINNNNLQQQKQPDKFTIRKFIFKTATFNVSTASETEQLGLICSELETAGITAAGLQETRIPGTGKKVIPVKNEEFEVYWSGKDGKKEYGVAICLKRSRHVEFERVEYGNDRMMAVDARIAGVKFRIVSCYAPQNGRSLSEKTQFYHDLEKLIVSKECHRKLLLLGDFNSFCSSFHRNCNFTGKNIDELSEYESHESGDMFIDFCIQHKLGSLATFYQHSWLHRATHYNNNDLTVRVYDHLVCSEWLRKFTLDCRVRNNIHKSQTIDALWLFMQSLGSNEIVN